MSERLDHFMARANAAYYASHDPYRDFTTSPEITQVFGELLGLWAAVTWAGLGRPRPVILAEAGAGRGTLMADALRAIGATAPDFAAALQLHLVETSPALRDRQLARLPQARCHDSLSDLPDLPLILLANEFLDALPIRQFIRLGETWAERWVAAGSFTHRPTCEALPEAPPGTILERCETATRLAETVGQRLLAQPGAALFIDPGPEHGGPGDSLQALRQAVPADPLADPGACDLTAHVDFAAFAAAARAGGAQVHGPLPQGVFLTRLGLFQRTDRLARQRPYREAAGLIDAAARLAEPHRMGRLFKVLALGRPGDPVPAGFEP